MNPIRSIHLRQRIAYFSRNRNSRHFINPSQASLDRLYRMSTRLLSLGWIRMPDARGGYFMFPPLPELEQAP